MQALIKPANNFPFSGTTPYTNDLKVKSHCNNLNLMKSTNGVQKQ